MSNEVNAESVIEHYRQRLAAAEHTIALLSVRLRDVEAQAEALAAALEEQEAPDDDGAE